LYIPVGAGQRIAGRLTVVVDTGAGNGRRRPPMPPLDHLDIGFLDDVRAAGFDYNDST